MTTTTSIFFLNPTVALLRTNRAALVAIADAARAALNAHEDGVAILTPRHEELALATLVAALTYLDR